MELGEAGHSGSTDKPLDFREVAGRAYNVASRAGLINKNVIAVAGNQRFVRIKSSIICLMCFNKSGSVTPCLDFGYNIN